MKALLGACVLISGCAREIPLRIDLHVDAEALGQAVTRVLVEVDDGDKLSSRAQAYRAEGEIVLPAAMELSRGDHVTLAVTGFGDGSDVPLAFGEQRFVLPQDAAASVSIPLAFGLLDRFVPHPFPFEGAREHMAIATLESGAVWIMGGRGANNQLLRETLIYDPSTLTFKSGPSLTTGRADPGVAVVKTAERGELIVLVGGETTEGPSFTCEVIDPRALRVGTPSNLTIKRAGVSVFALNDSVMACGGHNASGEASSTCEVLKITQDLRAEPATLPGGAVPALPKALSGAVALSDGQRYFLAGAASRSEVFEFFPASGSFAAATVLPTSRTTAAQAILSSGQLFVAAGGNDALDRWPFAQMPQSPTVPFSPRGERSLAQLIALPGGTLLLSGGRQGDARLVDNRLFDLANNAETVIPFRSARAAHRLVMVKQNSAILAIGGNSDGPTVEYLPWCERDTLKDRCKRQ